MIAGLAEHGWEHGEQVGRGVDVAYPAPFVVVTQHDLGDGEAGEFTVGEIGSVSAPGTGRSDVVVDQHVECRQKGVQLIGHTLILNTLLPCPDHGSLLRDLHRINHLATFALAGGPFRPENGVGRPQTPSLYGPYEAVI